ncbi:MAG TPA: N-acetylmuramoyl-L-alanine amidase [Solirubrobacteraceae bacterium]|nr:N-acetylmuramoyl-L-alanine amidase [Solirubrobacteraceae bacterium]
MSGAPRVSRRDVLAGAAAATTGLLLAAPAAMASERRRAQARLVSVDVGPLSGACAPIPLAPFALAGVQWRGAAAARIQLRARALDGRWSRWAPASAQGHDPDRPGAGPLPAGAPRFGEPVWFGASDALEVRSDRPLADVTVHAVPAAAPGFQEPSTDALARSQTGVVPYPLALPVLQAGPGQPPIIARRAWAGDANGPSAGPYYGEVRLAFVHHTETPNGYAADQVPAMILSIYEYHRFVRGFFDIAYNFMVDAFGRVWEARAGGIDEPVIGAHAGGYNQVSTGVAVLGSFMSAVPPAPAVDALTRLLSWKLSLHGVPTDGSVTVRVDPADAFYTPFAPGQLVSLPRIAGHRDGDLTDCPGDALYARLEAIRPRALALAGSPAHLTLQAAPAVVLPQAPVALGGRLTTLAGAPIAGAQLALQTVAGIGRTTTFATALTADDGSWSAGLTPGSSVVVRALYEGPPAAVSDLVLIGVQARITLALSPGRPPRVTGTVTPAKRSVAISVYRIGASGRRRLADTLRVRVRGGEFSARLPVSRLRAGRYLLVASTSADRRTVASESAPLTISL